MYFLLYLVVLLLTLLITKVKFKTIIKSNVLFTTMWCVCGGVSSLGLYGIFPPSAVAHIYSITAIVIFNIVFFVHNKSACVNNFSEVQGVARLRLIYAMNIISWVYISGILLKSLIILESSGLRGVRLYAFDSSMGLATTRQLMIIQLVIQSVFVATVLISMIYLVMGKKVPLLTVVAVVDVAIYTIMFGGRYSIVHMMMYYIFAFLILKSTDLQRLKKKKVDILFIGLIITFIIVITSQRGWGQSTFIKNTLVYYTGSFTFLDVIKDDVNWSSAPLYGEATFGFLINVLLLPWSIITHSHYNGSDYVITQLTAVPRFISPSQTYNAMTTLIYPFLRDFGYTGVILGTSFLAWFISFSENKFKKTNHLLFLCLYVYLAFVLFDSVMSYDLLFPGSGITMALLFAFTKSTKVGLE